MEFLDKGPISIINDGVSEKYFSALASKSFQPSYREKSSNFPSHGLPDLMAVNISSYFDFCLLSSFFTSSFIFAY